MKKLIIDEKNILISSSKEDFAAKHKFDAHLWVEDGEIVKNHTEWGDSKLKYVLDLIKTENFYFIYYEIDKYQFGHGYNNMTTMKCQKITNDNPLQFQINSNIRYNHFHDDGDGGKIRKEFRVITWNEITIEEYLKFKDKI